MKKARGYPPLKVGTRIKYTPEGETFFCTIVGITAEGDYKLKWDNPENVNPRNNEWTAEYWTWHNAEILPIPLSQVLKKFLEAKGEQV